MSHWIKRTIFRAFGAVLCLAALTSCDVSTPTHSGDNSVIPSNLRMVSYNELPGWRDDDVRYALQAFRNSCRAKIQFTGRVIPDRALFAEKCRMLPSASADAATIRAWFESNFQPYQIFDDNGGDTGLYTGYYSPIIPGCRTKTAQCNEPLMGVPTDGRNYKGVPKKQIVEQQIGRPLYWANIVDVQNIQIQGSGMLQLDDGTMVKLNFAAVNDLPFKSIGEQLRARGIRPPNGYSADAVWQYLKQNPTLAIAMDDDIYTLGLPVYVATSLSDGRQFRRLMIAQDTGSAIRGWIRADIFFGKGDEAYQFAHGQHSMGKMYILMPKEYTYVKPE